jgi:hypothetical protein
MLEASRYGLVGCCLADIVDQSNYDVMCVYLECAVSLFLKSEHTPAHIHLREAPALYA